VPDPSSGYQPPPEWRVRYGELEKPREQVARFLRAAIDAGTFRPGSKLPSNIELGAAYGTSPEVVRLATAILADEGRVVVRPRYGTFVAALS
jgi:DNA-binding GntR family transcriptional regulator